MYIFAFLDFPLEPKTALVFLNLTTAELSNKFNISKCKRYIDEEAIRDKTRLNNILVSKDRNKKYTGQTRLSIHTRFKEHVTHLKSSVTQHIKLIHHRIHNSKGIKHVIKSNLLTRVKGFDSFVIQEKLTAIHKCPIVTYSNA